MGMHADDAVNEALDQDDWVLDYLLGAMTKSEAFDRGLLDNFGALIQYTSNVVSPKACRYCGKSGLIWIETDEGWRLSEDRKVPHVCLEYFYETEGI